MVYQYSFGGNVAILAAENVLVIKGLGNGTVGLDKLEYMDLVGVKECTDARFLPPRYRDTSPEELEQRIDSLRRFV